MKRLLFVLAIAICASSLARTWIVAADSSAEFVHIGDAVLVLCPQAYPT